MNKTEIREKLYAETGWDEGLKKNVFYTLDGIELIFAFENGRIDLTSIRAIAEHIKRQGRATRAVQTLLAFADKHGLIVRTLPERIGKLTDPDTARLAQWYESFGFGKVKHGYMTRNPHESD